MRNKFYHAIFLQFLGPVIRWDGNNWSDVDRIESRLQDISPAVVSTEPGRINVFAIGSDDLDGQVVAIWWPENGPWAGPWPLPGQTRGVVGRGGPAAVSINPGRVDVVAINNDGNLIHWSFDGEWRAPVVINPGQVKLDPAARPCIAHQSGTDTFFVLATRSPNMIFGSRTLACWQYIDGQLQPQFDSFSWLNACGPKALYASSDRLFLTAARDDGKISFTYPDPSYRSPEPAGLTVTARAFNHMRLDWSVPDRVVRFEVWSKGNFLFIPTDHKITDIYPPRHSYEETNLWPGGARYCYFIRGYDSVGGYADSNVSCAQMDPPTRRGTDIGTMQGPNLGFSGEHCF